MCVAVGDKTSLELLDGAIGVALDGEHIVAMHDVGSSGHNGDGDHDPRLVLDQSSELTGNSIAPVGSVG